jgi:hypothetical protein
MCEDLVDLEVDFDGKYCEEKKSAVSSFKAIP